MNARFLKSILVGSVSFLLILIVALSTTSLSSAASNSPFVGSWSATDTDGSDIRLVIAGKSAGPFKITSTDSYISYCNGEAGIIQGSGLLNPENSTILEASLKVICFTTGDTLEIETSFIYNPPTDTISGISVTWHRANAGESDCLPPPMGMSGWWPGDGNTEDIISYRNGIFMGDATTGSGLVEQAFILDGDGDYIEVPDDPALNFGFGDFTIDLWVNFNNINGEQVLMEKWVQDNPISQGWTLTKLTGQILRLAMDDGKGSEYDLDSPEVDLQPNTWYLFAATRQGRWVTLYMNGTAIASAEVDLLNLDSPTSLKFGRRGDERGLYLNGFIDEVEIYNGTALSQDQILGLYSTGAFGKCKGYFKTASIRAHPEWDSVDAWFWPEDKILQLTIDDPNTKNNPDIKLKKSGADKFAGTVWFELTGYDLKPGDIVMISDGVFSKTLIVSILTINSVDVSSDIVTGTAAPAVTVRLPYTSTGVSVTADASGYWEADLGSLGYDVLPGTTMIAEEFDNDGDLTSFEYDIPGP
jgi:hypothetical protein